MPALITVRLATCSFSSSAHRVIQMIRERTHSSPLIYLRDLHSNINQSTTYVLCMKYSCNSSIDLPFSLRASFIAFIYSSLATTVLRVLTVRVNGQRIGYRTLGNGPTITIPLIWVLQKPSSLETSMTW